MLSLFLLVWQRLVVGDSNGACKKSLEVDEGSIGCFVT